MKYIQSFDGWKFYQIKDGYKARKGIYWSGLFKSLDEARRAIHYFESQRRLQATRE